MTSQRGAHGGYRLRKSLDAIPVADVILAINGPIALTAPVMSAVGTCESQSLCPMAGRWGIVNDAASDALNAITLADMQREATPKVLRFDHSAPLGSYMPTTVQ